MKKILLTAGIILSGLVYSQVGVNNQTPSTTFDVRAKRDASGNITDNTQTIGMQAPRLTRAELTANTANYGTNQNGALIYITDISGGDAASGTQRENITSVGYYYFDAAAASGAGRWIKMAVGDGGSPYTANNGLTMTGNNTKLGGTLIENTTIAQDTYTTNFTSAATTGTSHFTVDGTTFNVDAVNNRVAIGTATPSAKLDVQGNQYINAAITSAASKNALDINIGQPSYSYGNRVENFGINMRTNTDSGGSQIARINFGDESTGTLNGTRYLSFSVGNPVLNELMYLTSSNNGRVGIGTTTPAGRLHIVENGSTSAITASYNTPGILLTGPSSSNGLSGPGLYFEALGNPTGQRVMKVNMTTDGTNGFLNYQSVSNDASASVTTIMSVVSNGRVGIGNYNPGAKLEVNNGNTNGAIKIVDGTQGSGKVLTSDANGLATWQTIPSATPYTASNGLTMASNNVKLGGTLTENTTIAQGNNSVTFSGNSNVNITTTNTSGYPLSIVHPLSSSISQPGLQIGGATGTAATGQAAFIGFNPNNGQGAWPISVGAQYISGSSGQGAADFFVATSSGGAADKKLIVKNNGDVGIGTTAPTSKLSVNGTADKPGGGSWGTFSDARVKKDIRDYQKGLKEILAIRPVTFEYNGKSPFKADGKTYVGVIAQEIEKVLPSTVTKTKYKDFEDLREYNGSELTYTLINAVKEQQAEIEQLKKDNKELSYLKVLIKNLQAEVEGMKKNR